MVDFVLAVHIPLVGIQNAFREQAPKLCQETRMALSILQQQMETNI